MREEITILHTNDIHSHLERWPKIRRYLTDKRARLVQDGVSVLTFDIGDALDRQHPLTEATMGQGNVLLLNEVGYDGVTLGNNEILGLSHTALNHLYDDANFDVLISNMTDMATDEVPEWALTSKIITTPKGTRIGVLGLTAPFILTMPLLGWMPQRVDERLTAVLDAFAGKTDLNILLSHLGLPTDQYLAERFPDLQVIIGAHTHHLLAHGERRGSSLLAAAGKYGENIGKIDITMQEGSITRMQARTIATDELPDTAADAVEVANYIAMGNAKLAQDIVGVLPTAYTRDLKAKHRLIDLGLSALKKRTGTDIAMLSTGMFLGDLAAGQVTKKDLHDILPHTVHPIKVTLTGSDLWRLVHEVKKSRAYMLTGRIRGMGFRGDQWGEIVWSGLNLADNGDVFVQDELLDGQELYTIGALDHYYFLPFFPTIELVGNTKMSYDTVLREDFGEYLATKFN
ncbi:MAG: metallophosphoesterase [Lactobacillaceae bacterium]|nr:metallophosphoesterase [Lactobacillaceae bacterium]